MSRIEFSAATKRRIAKRAGHECSFPTCCRRTVSADRVVSRTCSDGVAAHIFSASPKGPRGQGELTPEELEQQENGIWLCANHAMIVDNNRGIAYPPETLLSYKMLQEARVMREVQGLYPTVGWVHEMEITKAPIFAPGQNIRLAKLNLFFGKNATGKTALAEWLAGAFDHTHLSRWTPPFQGELSFRISFLNPDPVQISVTIAQDGEWSFAIGESTVPFSPLGMRVVFLQQISYRTDDGDLPLLEDALGLPQNVIRGLAQEINHFPHAKMQNVRFVRDRGVDILQADFEGSPPGLSFACMSSYEQEVILIEFAVAAARFAGLYQPSLLILDRFPSPLHEQFFSEYSDHFLNPKNQFQTVMCIPSQDLDLDAIRWQGWEVVRTKGKAPDVQLTQELRRSGKGT